MRSSLENVNTLALPTAAISYAILGWPVFPVEHGRRSPPLVRWTEEATTDLATIQQWWTYWPEANIGLPMGQGRCALDLDRKEGRDGWQSYLMLGGPANPPWPVQRTPSGGLHLIWDTDEVFRNFTRRGAKGGLDMRSEHGYIIGAPSVVDGRTYRWADGDPCAPVPASLRDACRGFSQQAIQRSGEAFPMVDASVLDQTEIQRRLDALGADHARFLRSGQGVTGDDSRDAYHACLRAFSLGWSLQDMAAIGPETYLGVFGSHEPHNARDPWQWCWRYTVQAAWREANRQKETGSREFARTGDHLEEGLYEEGAVGVRAAPGEQNTTSGLDVYQLLEQRAQGLAHQDRGALIDWLRELLGSGLSSADRAMLLPTVKAATGFGLKAIRDKLSELEEGGRQARERARAVTRENVPDVYVEAQGKVLNRITGGLVAERAFLTLKAREHGGDMNQAHDAWLKGEQALCDWAHDLTYDPSKEPGVVTAGAVRLYNRYKPSELLAEGSGTEADVAPWLNLLRSLELEEGERAERWLLDRLAWIVQRPGVKFNHGILLGGDKGIGKDSFLFPVLEAVGLHNVQITDGADLNSSFNSYLKNTKLLVINEIDFGDHRDRRSVNEKLKRVLASPPHTLTVNEKNLRPYEIPNLVQVIGQTNHRACMHADEGERRYLPLWCGVVRQEADRARWTKWFGEYWHWVRHGGSARVLAFLRRRDVSGFQPGAKPPETTWLRDIMIQSRSGLEIWLLEQIEGREGIFAQDFVRTEDVLTLLGTGAGAHWVDGPINRNAVSAAMFAIGCQSVRKGYRRARYWKLRESIQKVDEIADKAAVIRAENRFRAAGEIRLPEVDDKPSWL